MARILMAVGVIYLIMMSMVTPGNCEECGGELDGNGVVDGSDLVEIASDYWYGEGTFTL